MKAAYYGGPRQIEIRECVPVAPAAGQVRVRVSHCGICGTDLHVYLGDLDQTEDAEENPIKGKPQFFVNPQIMWSSDESNVYNEGCLSIPGQYAEVERPEKVKLKYLDYDGKEQTIDCDGLLATCIQHEIDHLEGILFVDHLSTLKRDMLMRKLKKWTKEFADDIEKSHVL